MSKLLLMKSPLGFSGGPRYRSSATAFSFVFTASRTLYRLPTHASIPVSYHASLLHFDAVRGANRRSIVLYRAFSSSEKSGEVVVDGAAVGSSGEATDIDGAPASTSDASDEAGNRKVDGHYPTGELELIKFDWWRRFLVKIRMLLAPPWERVKKGSVLTMKLRGQISDQIKSRFASGLSLPQICENLTKAAYDSRISGIYLQIEPLSCGWAKIEEIHRHIINFKKSGKFIISYIPVCREREYYLACACGEIYAPPSAYISLYGLTVQATFLRGVLDNIGVEPEIERIGAYKSAGDQLLRKTMSKEMQETLTTLLDNIYGNWLDTVASNRRKERKEVEEFINRGVYQVEKLKEEGWLTDILYDDEITSMIKDRQGQEKRKSLLTVDDRKYSRVRKWTLGLEGKGHQIAVIRATGSISRARGPLSVSSSGIIAEKLIEKIREIRDSNKYKAVILRIDSPGGDALASDLMWREIKLLSASKPVIASLSDVAASGGYYMAMAAEAVVADKLTLTGSIGVVTGKFSLHKLYERIGFNKELLSRGKYAELLADNRPFRPAEAELFKKAAQNSYKQFRDKAAYSRSMSEEEMEKVAQGRVWSGNDAASKGLVDAIGGFERAVAIAKQKANIPLDKEVRLVEVSKPSPTLPEILSSIGNSVFNLEETLKEALKGLSFSGGVQARFDGILFENILDEYDQHPIVVLVKECLRSF